MMLVNIIFAVSFVPVWPILYFMLRNNTKPKKNIILSVTLPESAHGDPEVLAICRGFKRWLNRVMLPLLPLLAPPFFMSVTGVALTWFMIWLLAALAAPPPETVTQSVSSGRIFLSFSISMCWTLWLSP